MSAPWWRYGTRRISDLFVAQWYRVYELKNVAVAGKLRIVAAAADEWRWTTRFKTKEKLYDCLNQNQNRFIFCHKPPSDYQLDMGNTCNLKCRTCTSQFSSRIAADTVHQRWEKATFTHSTPMKNVNTDNQSRLNSKPPWYEDERFLFEEFLSRPEEYRICTSSVENH